MLVNEIKTKHINDLAYQMSRSTTWLMQLLGYIENEEVLLTTIVEELNRNKQNRYKNVKLDGEKY